MLDDAEAGLLDRPFGEMSRLLPGGNRHRFRDPKRGLPVVAAKALGGPAGTLEKQRRLAAPSRRRLLEVEDAFDLDVHQAVFRDPGPITSRRAWPIATSTRCSMSSESAWVIRMPGLNWSTLGSRVEKMAHTPFR